MLTKPQITLLAVTSLDGFIAKQSGHAPATWASVEEQQHFLKQMDQMDISVMGRVTHEAAFRPDRKRIIFSSSAQSQAQNKEWCHPNHLWVNPANMDAADILACLDGASKVALLGGTRVHDWFLEHGLIDVIELSVEPQMFGQGLALFDDPTWQGYGSVEEIEPAMAAIGFSQQGPVHHLNEDGTFLMRFYRQK